MIDKEIWIDRDTIDGNWVFTIGRYGDRSIYVPSESHPSLDRATALKRAQELGLGTIEEGYTLEVDGNYTPEFKEDLLEYFGLNIVRKHSNE